MSLKESLKAEAKIEKQKLKEMSLNDKIWYIWEYYKFHIAGLIGVFFLISIVVTSIYNSTIETNLYTVIVNNPMGMETNVESLTTEFEELMGFEEKSQTITETMYITYGEATDEYSYGVMAKITALIAGNELDIMITDQNVFDHHKQMGAFADLETTLPTDLWEVVKDRAVYSEDPETGKTIASAIDINGTAFAEKYGIRMNPAYVSIIVNSQRMDNCIAMLRYMFDLPV